jgi:hypothetical protein
MKQRERLRKKAEEASNYDIVEPTVQPVGAWGRDFFDRGCKSWQKPSNN